MGRHIVLSVIFSCLFVPELFSQKLEGTMSGFVICANRPIPGVFVELHGWDMGTYTDQAGRFELRCLASGTYTLRCKHPGYEAFELQIDLSSQSNAAEMLIYLQPRDELIEQIVITGTRTPEKQSENPLGVRVLRGSLFDRVQACQLSEGLNYQTGLRVETDCQTCNYTQLRMNGLGGGYTQILVNGHPLVSALAGLYSLEQLPSYMVERIEVTPGGRSALYGSGAMAGTVNIITREPKPGHGEAKWYFSNLQRTRDHGISCNYSFNKTQRKPAWLFYVSLRDRDWYDHNGDNYSELPALRSAVAGMQGSWKRGNRQQLRWTAMHLSEFRSGGEMVNRPLPQRGQVEERRHLIFTGSADYNYQWANNLQSISGYLAAQHTSRKHFTGVRPDSTEAQTAYELFPPEGNSLGTTFRTGAQYNFTLLFKKDSRLVFSSGLDHLADAVLDEIPAYRFTIDQETQNTGWFAQVNWNWNKQLFLLSGLRVDRHNLLGRMMMSPRFSAMYKPCGTCNLRFSAGSGFRAPQAFDTDLHIAFAGGGVSRIQQDPGLEAERSGSLALNFSYDHAWDEHRMGFSTGLFHTSLQKPFLLESAGSDSFGAVFLKTNGTASFVRGIQFETRANFRRKFEMEAGYTFQVSRHRQPQKYFDDLIPLASYLRTPDRYGYHTLSWKPSPAWTINFQGVFTGPMLLVRQSSNRGNQGNVYVRSRSFADLGLKISSIRKIVVSGLEAECYAGVKNILNSYQGDLDRGKLRDSNYVYGPASPRSYYFGLNLRAVPKDSRKSST